MSMTMLPFLYQTRTLQRACKIPVGIAFVRNVTTQEFLKRKKRNDNSIPFHWDGTYDVPEAMDGGEDSTITPSEAEVFKNIFEDIAKGRLTKSKQRSAPGSRSRVTPDAGSPAAPGERPGRQLMTGSVIDQVLGTESRERQAFLERYPPSLRQAAETAVGKFKLAPLRPRIREEMPELDHAEAMRREEWLRFQQAREAEKARMEARMTSCETDSKLWYLMQKEVFTLPRYLGLVDHHVGTGKGKQAKEPREEEQEDESQENESQENESQTAEGQSTESGGAGDAAMTYSMDIHGPLYSQYLILGLKLFDTAFERPSPFAFRILPRIKEIGMASYVLGVSTPLYAKLAEMYWKRFGDATSALDLLQEMKTLGLAADEQVIDLFSQMREDLHACTWGAQGSFVMAMMEAAPYDAALLKRLEWMEKSAVRSALYSPQK